MRIKNRIPKNTLGLRPIFYGFDSYVFEDALILENERKGETIKNLHTDDDDLWNKVSQMDPFSRRLIGLKYDREFRSVRTHRVVAELMCCSEETVRLVLLKLTGKERGLSSS